MWVLQIISFDIEGPLRKIMQLIGGGVFCNLWCHINTKMDISRSFKWTDLISPYRLLGMDRKLRDAD